MNTIFQNSGLSTRTSAMPMPTLSELVRDIQARLQRYGIAVADMRKAGALELELGIQPVEPPDTAPLRIERLEGPIVARRIEPRNESRFSWFLDGTQKTLPVWRVGVVPVVAGIAVAGILNRDAHGEWAVHPSAIRQRLTWIFPLRTGDPDLQRLEDILAEAGQEVRDPLAYLIPDDGDLTHYHAFAGNYGKMMFQAREIAGKVRGALEDDLVQFWDSVHRPTDPDGWLVVDGRLRRNVPNAVGLVKELLTQHLYGDEAVTLFSLPAGHRTSAFRYQSARAAGEDESTGSGRTMWYQRMWPAEGLDARHALVRIEAGHDIDTPEMYDGIASWLMAERIPRATQDARWPTLLYPIHLLEQLLKRRIAAMTVGWPAQ